MKLQLNGASIDAQVTTLAELLVAEGFGGAKVATAVNGRFVPVISVYLYDRYSLFFR